MKLLDFTARMADRINVTNFKSGFRAYGRKANEEIWFRENYMSAGSKILTQAEGFNLKFIKVDKHCRCTIEKFSTQNHVKHRTSVILQFFKEMEYRKTLLFFSTSKILIAIAGLAIDLKIISLTIRMSCFLSHFSDNICYSGKV